MTRKMKDSGIEWIGEIPEEWQVRKIFSLVNEIGSGTTPKGDKYYDGDYFWLNTGDLNDSYITEIKKTVNDNALSDYSALKIYPKGSIVIAMYGATIGKLGITMRETTVNQACCVMNTSEEIYNKLLFYILISAKDKLINSSYGAGQPNINQELIKQLKIPVPTIKKQQIIINYLDKKCNKIDQTIEKEKEVIEKLKEYKQSVITEAVTKGLNPEAPMKDSGVEWIGEIPEHWKIGRIKYNTYLKGRIGWQGLKASEFIEQGPFLVTGTDFEKGKVNWKKCYHISNDRYEEAPDIHLKVGDLLITKDGTVGKLAYIDSLPGEASLNSHLLLIRPSTSLYTNKYLYWIFSSSIFYKYTGLSQDGSIMASLSQEKINKFSFPVCSLEEQKQIISYLDKKCFAIDKLISNKEKLIEKLIEYKKSLIYECVTGKREVQ